VAVEAAHRYALFAIVGFLIVGAALLFTVSANVGVRKPEREG